MQDTRDTEIWSVKKSVLCEFVRLVYDLVTYPFIIIHLGQRFCFLTDFRQKSIWKFPFKISEIHEIKLELDFACARGGDKQNYI